MMKAIRLHAYGGPEVLVYEDAPRPELTMGEALIHVHAAGVNPVDWKMRQNGSYPLPFIPGWDISGEVVAVASDVTDITIGTAVYAMRNFSGGGAYAEYIAIRAAELAPKPQTLDDVHAAAVPMAALTAWQAIFDAAELSAGQTILIHGAAGGIGTFAVQLAHWKGARVIGTASAYNKDMLHDLGTDEFIDYTTARFEQVIHKVDVVLDTIGGEARERSWGVLKHGGTLVSTIPTPPSQEQAAAHHVRGFSIGVHPSRTQLLEIAQLIDTGQVKPIIQSVFPLAQARQAHEVSQQGHTRGKLVLHVAHDVV